MSSGLPQTAREPETAAASASPPRVVRWHRGVLSFCLMTFALEIGLFLAVYPWSSKWDQNFLPVRVPELVDVWMNPFFRGAVSGLGLLDVWVAGAEFVRFVRRALAGRKDDRAKPRS